MKYDKTKPTVTVSNPKWDHILLLPLPHPLSPGSLNLHKQWQNHEVESQWAKVTLPAVNFTSGEIFALNSQMASFPNSTSPDVLCANHILSTSFSYCLIFFIHSGFPSFSHLHVMSFLYVVIFFFLFFLFWMATKTVRHNSSRLLCIQTTCK